MRTRRPEGAAGTASDGPRPAAPADVQLRLLAFAGTVDGRLGVQSQVQLCCSSAGPQKSKEPHVCLPSASHRQALARGRSSSSAPAVAAWLCTQPCVSLSPKPSCLLRSPFERAMRLCRSRLSPCRKRPPRRRLRPRSGPRSSCLTGSIAAFGAG